MTKEVTLGKFLIQKMNNDNYRAGRLSGWKHPIVDHSMISAVGGLQKLLSQAAGLEEKELIQVKWINMKRDIERLDVPVENIPDLCQFEGIEDPRERQLKKISSVENWRKEVQDCSWIQAYYEEILERLRKGKKVADAEDEDKFRCINAVAHQESFVWERVFSSRVLGDSKKFQRKYRDYVVGVLIDASPYYEDGMSKDEILSAHHIHSYAQTLEYKGCLDIILEDGTILETSKNTYGTVLNAQTIEHSNPYQLSHCKRIMTIENKANYEEMKFEKDTLYIYCHGFLAPKEVRFIKKLKQFVDAKCQFYHWSDMDYGGINIFQFIKTNIFPELLPYKMDVESFQKAVEDGSGKAIEKGAREKLVKKDAGILTDLKEEILRTNLVIEQEALVYGSDEETVLY